MGASHAVPDPDGDRPHRPALSRLNTMSRASQPPFLPTTRSEMERLGWRELDVLLVTGDAYVDHPAFGAALLGRWLAAHGLAVGIVAQPRWDEPGDVARLGRPRLLAGVSAGALDSMLAHYTALRKKRSDDAYTPGGLAGARPNRAAIVYAGLVKAAFPGLPVVLGGVEASLRRAAHYDFWNDSLRRSILLDSKADLVVYGMGERAALEACGRLRQAPARDKGVLRGIPGTAFMGEAADVPAGAPAVRLPSFEEIQADPRKLMAATLALEAQMRSGAWAWQEHGGRRVVLAPPAEPLSTGEMDRLYGLPFARAPHPGYARPIPAVEMIRFSLTSHRGCAGGCSFCSLALHQGRRISSRSRSSLLEEARLLARRRDWDGAITDVGGPSANMWGARCAADPARCRRGSCLTPSACPDFQDGQQALAGLLAALKSVPGVRHVRVASGVRHDLALRSPGYLAALVREFTGGQLKLAPEHSRDRVLGLMRKPGFAAFERFLTVFEAESRSAGKQQFVVPYLMSAFPGCTDADMRALACWLKARGWKPRQVQCFVPTPGTVATAMYHAGIDPEGRPIVVARTDAERLRQHRILMPPAAAPR
ncbi:MAG: YgiQ family radical SAM protein [Elusimicrobia bacterium]|nr:YgiQ family radical SAM protein [Elusimicrobiota bacterium]